MPKTFNTCDSCGVGLTQRIDDRPDNFMHRINTYKRESEPVI